MTNESWSDDARSRIRAMLNQLAFVADGDELGLMHIDGRFGAVRVQDVLAGITKVRNRETEEEENFANVEELIRAGWVID